MGHSITAVIGEPAVVARVVSAAECPAATSLPFDLAIAPLGHRQIDNLTSLQPGSYHDGFDYFSEGLQRALTRVVAEGVLVYVETEYFGGMGAQAAAVISDGELVFLGSDSNNASARYDHPINAALRKIGVVADGHHDEFDALGLVRFRDLEALGLNEWDDD